MSSKLLILFLTLILTACGGGSSSTAPVPVPTPPQPAPPAIQKGKIVETNFDVNGQTRQYTLYVPQSYQENTKVPLPFSFHGLGGNMQRNYDTAKFYELAEQENFILVHPNGIDAKWNAVSIANNIDIDFVDALLTSLQSTYNIDSSKIYSTGMSNGGYFSIVLACSRTDKFASVASVTGLMFNSILSSCDPSRAMSLMQIHGTDDDVVDYDRVAAFIEFWTDHNQTTTTPTITALPNSNNSDGSEVEKHEYLSGMDNSKIVHFKVIGGDHSWPGASGNMDINASEEVWNFLIEQTLPQ